MRAHLSHLGCLDRGRDFRIGPIRKTLTISQTRAIESWRLSRTTSFIRNRTGFRITFGLDSWPRHPGTRPRFHIFKGNVDAPGMPASNQKWAVASGAKIDD